MEFLYTIFAVFSLLLHNPKETKQDYTTLEQQYLAQDKKEVQIPGTYKLSCSNFELYPDPRTNTVTIIPDVYCQFCDTLFIKVVDINTNEVVYTKRQGIEKITFTPKNPKPGDSYRIFIIMQDQFVIKKKLIMTP